MKNIVKVAGIQFDSKQGKKEANLSAAIRLVDEAADKGVKICALPDYFSTGIPLTKEFVRKWADTIPGDTTDRLGEASKKYRMYLMGGMIERKGERYFSTSPLIGPDGNVLGIYRKVNLFTADPLNEVGVGLTSGREHSVFRTDFGVIGMLLQCDIDFPEAAKVLALKGAEVVFWMTSVGYHWADMNYRLCQTYAFTNSMYLVMVNRTGRVEGYSIPFYGGSCIISPVAEVIASAGTSIGAIYLEGMAVADIDLASVRELRERWKLLERFKHSNTYKELKEIAGEEKQEKANL